MPPAITTQSITFENNREALAVFPPSNATADEIINALELKTFKAVLLIIGGADIVDEKVELQLMQLFGRGIARAAANLDALIIDGGTQSGVMALMGQGVGDRGFKSTLIGMAPLRLVNYPGSEGGGEIPLEPNHSHFVLVEGEIWGSETAIMFRIAELLTKKVPGVAILAGGGDHSKTEALRTVQSGFPLIVVEGSGGLADEIVAHWKLRPSLPDDPVLAEIIADGKLEFHRLSSPVEVAEKLISRRVQSNDVLFEAWEIFADYDNTAIRQQRSFARLQLPILTIGVLVTALTLARQVFAPNSYPYFPAAWWWVNQLLIIIPILLALLVTVANRFKHGNKWLLLRASAEAIKREIYRYRTRTAPYGGGAGSPDLSSPEAMLSIKIQDITESVMETEAGSTALVPYDKTKGFPPYTTYIGDDGLSRLTPERYIEVRLADQLSYFSRVAIRIERRWKLTQVFILLAGGIGSYLAAVGQQVWIALTTAIVAALTASLGYKDAERNLMVYNRAKAELGNLKRWWKTLSAAEQAKAENADALVEYTEQVLKSELDNWIQLKQSTIAELLKKQTAATDKSELSKQKEN